MKMTDIPHRVHFVGIGGVGMSALAQHLHKLGYRVTGSDRIASEQTELLHSVGIPVCIGHKAENVCDTQLIVRTSAVHNDNPEIIEAEKQKLPIILREELLGAVFNSFPERIAVCGTHGKTTATAMLHEVLTSASVSHTAFIGGIYCKSNYYFGKNVVIAEACEYNRSFYNLNPTITLCLNVEFDHPDCYKNLTDAKKSFGKFFANTASDGVVVLPRKIAKLCKNRRFVCFDDCNIQDVRLENGKPRFFLPNYATEVSLNIIGAHNVTNALAVIAVANELHIPVLQTLSAISKFCGVDRRWTEKQGVCRIVCDYAHHPTEIACSVDAARSITGGKVICVFQPHTYSRTKAFFKQFATCFVHADKVAYLPVYSARETPIKNVDSQHLAQKANNLGIDACFLPDFEQARNWVLRNVAKDDVLLILGAGDVVEFANYLQ